MVEEAIRLVAAQDPEIAEVINLELMRQRNNLELIASENLVSPAVMAAMSSVLTNKYAEGYPGRRYYGGCEHVDIAENICIERAKQLFGANFANVQPHSGSQANSAVYMALCKPGDTVLGMDLANGGHLTHGSPVSFSGKLYNIVSYRVNEQTGMIDYEDVRKQALENHPKMIIAGASAYPRAIDFKIFREIADEVGAYLFVDMAHIAGLVAGGQHMSPMPYADVVATTTHKTLRGPRGGIILSNDAAIAKKVNSAVFPGSQGGPLMHIIAAKAVALGEALKPEFAEYQAQVVRNAKVLGESLLAGGVDLVSGGTDNHLLLLDLKNQAISGRELEERLDSVRITVNKNMVPGDTRSPRETSGIRVGTPAVTTRGLKEEDIKILGGLICRTVFDYEASQKDILAAVSALCEKYPLYEGV